MERIQGAESSERPGNESEHGSFEKSTEVQNV
jgi:hypothetical protein